MVPTITTELLSYPCRHRDMCPDSPHGMTYFPSVGSVVSKQPQPAAASRYASAANSYLIGVTSFQGQSGLAHISRQSDVRI